MTMVKKKISLFLVLTMIVTSFCITNVYAEDSLESVQGEIDAAEDKLAEGQSEVSGLTDKISLLNEDIAAAQADIDTVNASIAEKEAELTTVTAELEAKELEIEQSTSELNERLRAMYKNGSLGFVDVLLNSEDVSELILNVEMVQMIYENDQDVVKLLEEDFAIIEAEKLKVETIKEELEAEKATLAESEQALEAAKDELAAERDKISDENLEIERQIQALEKEAEALTNQFESGNLGSSNSGDGSSFDDGNGFHWPTVSRYITSDYGTRPDPFGSGKDGWHSGIDLSANIGANIYAVSSGTVILSGWGGGYGNMVIVDHGGGVSTVYAHNSSLAVSVGQTVSRGQVIAYAGSTGNSTGPHLHFEVRENGYAVNPMNYL